PRRSGSCPAGLPALHCARARLAPRGAARPRRRARGADVTLSDLASQAGAIVDEIERAVVGKRDALELVLIGLLADGHVLLEDFPGLAKTLIARSSAQTCELEVARIQFTPELIPADVTGSAVSTQRTR